MAEESVHGSTPVREYPDICFEVMKENQEFLLSNAKGVSDEGIKLINDAIDHAALVTKNERGRELYVERSMVFFLYHVLMPFSYAVYTELLLGNTPGCFMDLRLMLESLVKCYAADSRYRNATLFHERLELLESKRPSINRLMREVGRQVGLNSQFADLWNELSREWVHTKGIVDRVVDRLLQDSGVPNWALVVPMAYTESDLYGLDHVRTQMSRFRTLLAHTMEEYREEIGF